MSDLLGNEGTLHPVRLSDEIRCIEREIRMRERVYPGFVHRGKMRQVEADFEISCMKSVLRRLKSIEP